LSDVFKMLLDGKERTPLTRSEVPPVKLVIYSFGHATNFNRERIVPIKFLRRSVVITGYAVNLMMSCVARASPGVR
jgi:hypothetical protein